MTQPQFPRQHARTRRLARGQRGAVLVVVLVSMLVVMTMIGSMLRGTLRVRGHLHAERDLRQTELVLQAGADRAAFRLANEPDYRGETWNLPDIVGRGDGQVTIAASRSSAAGPWDVRVIAEYPTGSESSIRRSRTFSVPLQPSLAQE